MGGSGAMRGMIDMLKNNELIKKKILHFKNKSGAKYRYKELKFKKRSLEDIEKVKLKIKKQERVLLIKKLCIFIFSLTVVISLIFLLLNKISEN